MTSTRRHVTRALLGAVVVLLLLVMSVGQAAATTQEDCGGGDIDLVQSPDDPATIIGARVRNVGPSCDGQPVGVQFLGNAQGDPDQAPVELARAHSDEDPCTGAERPRGVLAGGSVEVALCSSSSTSGYVNGAHLTQLRLITTLDAPAAPGGGDGLDAAPVPDPAPAAPEEDLPMTGAAILRAVLLGAALVALGAGLLDGSRRAAALRHR